MTILGIESSCDETAAAVVVDGRQILSQAIESQVDIHAQYGGVVPEVASRSHLEAIIPVVDLTLQEAFPSMDPWPQIDAIAVTNGPGLSGGLLIGTLTARTLALIHDKPVYAINHVLGHTYANWLGQNEPQFPVLSLTASGGHTQLLLLKDHLNYTLLGQTRDDAAGEAFDKIAKMLGLPYPGGPSIAEAALSGNPERYRFPKAQLENKYDFSFSGLKTAVLRTLQKEVGADINLGSSQIAKYLDEQQVADFAASFQKTTVDTLVAKLKRATGEFKPQTVMVGGGVAANQELRKSLEQAQLPNLHFTDINLCTDNAAMIAGLAYFQSQNQPPTDINKLLIKPSLSL